MSDQNDIQNNNGGGMSKDQLWAKAGTSKPITRDDLGIAQPNNNSGMQALNEGYLGDIHRFTLNDENNGGSKEGK